MAKSLRPDVIQLQVVVDGSPARKELAERSQQLVQMKERVKDLRAEEKRLIEERRAAKGDAEKQKQYAAELARVRGEIKQLNGTMGQQESRMAELRQSIGTTALSIRELRKELRAARVAYELATPGTEQQVAAKAKVDELSAAYDRLTKTASMNAAIWEEVRGQYRLTDMTMEQLELESNRLRLAMRQIDPNSAQFAQYNRELAMVERRQRAVAQQGTPLSRFFANIKQELNGVLGLTAGLFAGGVIVSKIGDWVRASAKLSDAQADVRRTTGLTQQQVEELTSSLGKMNTRTARSELLALAADAGKLGITGTQDLQKFVRAGDQIRVALGEDLGDEAIKNIGKLNQTFKVGEATGKDLEQQMLSTGSAINALGQASTAQEGFLVDYTTRMAGVNTQAKISIENTLGYGAALDQLGQRSETSSTAISQFTLKAFKETATYAKIAGMETAEFARLLDTDANEALLRVLDGLRGNNEGLSRMTELFADMGQEGARAVGVLASLANNTKLIREQQAIANKEFAAATSITEEFNTKNNTLAANLDIIGRRIMSAFVNSDVVAGINRMVNAMRRWVEVPVSETLEEQRMGLMRLYSQVLITNQGTEERARLIREMQAMYPQLLGNLNAETTTNTELAASIRRVNQELVNRIVIQRQQEKIDEQQQVQADRLSSILEAEREIQTDLVRLAEEHNIALEELGGTSVLEQAANLYDRIRETQRKTGQEPAFSGVAFDNVARFGKAINQLSIQYSKYNTEVWRSSELEKEKAEIMARLGITDAPSGTTQPAATTTPATAGAAPEGTSPAQEATETATAEHLATMEQMLREHRERVYQFGLGEDERQLRQLDVKHADELAQLLANEQATQNDLLGLMRIHEQERADLIAEQGNERLRARDQVAEQVRRATLSEQELELENALQHWDGLIAEARKYGIDTAELEEARQRALDAIRSKWNKKEVDDTKTKNRALHDAQMQALTASAQAVGGLSDVMAAFYDESEGKGFEHTAAAKVLGLIQIKIAAAVAVANAIVAATEAAKVGGPAAPFLVAANIGLAVGSVLAAIAQAKNMLGAAGDPASALGGGDQGGTPSPDSVPLGADGMTLPGPSHSEGGLGVYNNLTGQQVAELEGGELVLSKRFAQVNADQVATLLRASKEGARLNFINRPLPSISPRTSQVLAEGGVVGSGTYTYHFQKKRTGAADPGDGGEQTALLARAVDLLLGIKAATEQDRTIRWSVREQERKVTEYEETRARNRAGRSAS